MSTTPRRRRARVALALAAALSIAVGSLTASGATAGSSEQPLPVQLVTVDTPTRADKDRLVALGLDLTEHAGHDYIEVVLHSAADADALRAAGFTWDVRIPDLVAREQQIAAANRAYAASVDVSPLPSGRDSYRTLADYHADLDFLAGEYPELVKPFELTRTTLEGKPIRGIEVAADVHAPEDGRPVFAMFGLHHAREWPSGEHTIEFAFDLLEGYGNDERITTLLEKTRVLLVPVVNADGFEKSVDDGLLVDLRQVDDDTGGDGTVAIVATPGHAYKRKNCRVADGTTPVAGSCQAAFGPGGFGVGVDLNRNYGGLWGGPGASNLAAHATYRGAEPFSEPETQAVRELVSTRQVTTLITNHTFSNLVLRPNGVQPDTIGPDGHPVGDAPDEPALKALGAEMAAQNGYRNIHGWELYDTTGTTEDWSYNATGGFGYTFEIGPDEFHPPFPEVIDEYVGAGGYEGKGNREAYLIALEHAANPTGHSVVTGRAPEGATLRLSKSFETPTWTGAIDDSLSTSMTVGRGGKFEWHVNPSSRPVVAARQIQVTADEPLVPPTTWTGTTLPGMPPTEHEFVVEQSGVDLLEVKLDWPTPDDLDLYVLRREADGSLTQVGSSTNFVIDKERALVQAPAPGTYVLRVVNFASASPTWTMTASLFDQTEQTIGGLVEAWTLTCERDGAVLQTAEVVVDRGAQSKVDLRECLRAFRRR